MHSNLNPGFYVSVSCKAQCKCCWNHSKSWWLNAMLFLTLLGFTNSMIALPCLPQFRRPVLWEEMELHKKPLVVLREIGFMHSMSAHGFMSGMCMKFLVKFSLWHVLPKNPLNLISFNAILNLRLLGFTISTISIPFNSQSWRLVLREITELRK